MSRALKIIVGIILAVFIAAGAALIIPQFLGIDVVVMQEQMSGNVTLGTAVYAKKAEAAGLAAGDRILDQGVNTMNVYNVQSYDASAGTAVVSGGWINTLNITQSYMDVLLVVPYIGYLSIAAQSMKGLIFLGVLLALVVFLFIASEILRRRDTDDDFDEEDEPDQEEEDAFYRDLAERKRSADARSEREYGRSRRNRRSRRSEREEEEPEDDYYDDEETSPRNDGLTEISQNASETSRERAADKGLGTDALPDVQAALEAALENQPMNRTEEINLPRVEPEEEQFFPDENGEIELAMPVYTAEELIQKAYAQGHDPKITKEPVTGVTLVDYSDSL